MKGFFTHLAPGHRSSKPHM